MRITSTKLTTASRAAVATRENVAGVILAAPEMTFQSSSGVGEAIGTIGQGMYVFPASPHASDPLKSEIAGLAKMMSVQLAAGLHPHLGTGVRAGWLVVGAISLLGRVKENDLPWIEVALEGGELAIETLNVASSVLPESVQFNTDWTEGTSILLQATKHASEGGDASQFVMAKTLDQSMPLEYTRKLLSLALAAQHPNSELERVKAKKIDVKVQWAPSDAA